MNILIVGNGFDLSHYLPTKYDHFMLVMKAIEGKDLAKPIKDALDSPFYHPIHLITKYLEISRVLDHKSYQMNFYHLFSQFKKARDMEFIDNTKKNYDVANISLTKIQILEIQSKLKKNRWYQYFKNHVEEIKTWIDFEQQIEGVLKLFSKNLLELEKCELANDFNNYFNKDNKNYQRNMKDLKVMKFFNIYSIESKELESAYDPLNPEEILYEYIADANLEFCHGKNINNGFSATAFLDFLHQELEDFIEIFDLYLELIIDKLSPIFHFSIIGNGWASPDKIYSFNYTNIYQKFYAQSADTDFLHGRFGKDQNIVLGVSELQDESLKKLKAYGFTKYHQKLFKDTDYLFLDKYKVQIQSEKEMLRRFKIDYDALDEENYRNKLHRKVALNLNFFIWGHSLDISDKDYIIDLFSLNDGMDRKVRVTVYYFDKNAKFSLLNNLLAILQKDKVEQWMKNKWLKFEKNPDIAALNNIEPVELPKIAKA